MEYDYYKDDQYGIIREDENKIIEFYRKKEQKWIRIYIKCFPEDGMELTEPITKEFAMDEIK